MAFILRKDRSFNSFEEWKAGSEAYRQYLESIKTQLPTNAYEFAIASWRFSPESHMDPHDSWLESLTIREPASGERAEIRSVDITIRLLGSYHDGRIEIIYKNVQSYSIHSSPQANDGHGDWLYDEIRLSERGYMLHEIEWARGSEWLIECADFTYCWMPFDKA
jgi:hypothetical protein